MKIIKLKFSSELEGASVHLWYSLFEKTIYIWVWQCFNCTDFALFLLHHWTGYCCMFL